MVCKIEVGLYICPRPTEQEQEAGPYMEAAGTFLEFTPQVMMSCTCQITHLEATHVCSAHHSTTPSESQTKQWNA